MRNTFSGGWRTASRRALELLGEITVVVGPAEAGGVTDREEVFRLIAEERNWAVRPTFARRVQTRTAGWTGWRDTRCCPQGGKL
ncbi:MAG: hypothetical protein ACLR0N_08350 [Bilophila wadsworthia]